MLTLEKNRSKIKDIGLYLKKLENSGKLKPNKQKNNKQKLIKYKYTNYRKKSVKPS